MFRFTLSPKCARVLGRALCLLSLVSALLPLEVAAVVADVVWTAAKCDFILIRNEDGHGIVYKATPVVLKAGDKLDGALDHVGYFRKIAVVGTTEAHMMRGMKYGVRRQLALDLIAEWSSYCDPPEN
jgi:hypothetical protein